MIGRNILKYLYHYFLIARSGNFDSLYYLENYPDVRKSDTDPLMHFIKYGWMEGRNPSLEFNTKIYLRKNEDVSRSRINPLIHYIKHGSKEGRITYPGNCPKVSIIVPNFNHEDYLVERLDSIYNQTFEDFEVILLDDASTDRSSEILREYESLYPEKTTCYFNTKNSGSPFMQWKKGISLAIGEFVWIAECDDYCENDFLEKLVPYFSDPSIVLGYCKTEFIDECSNFRKYTYKMYLSELDIEESTSSYINSAEEEVSSRLGMLCTIPSISSVLFRNKSDNFTLFNNPYWLHMKMCGDWIFYLNLIKDMRLVYCHETQVYHRVHLKSSSEQVKFAPLYFSEHEHVARELIQKYNVSDQTLSRFRERIFNYYVFSNQNDVDVFSKYFDYEKYRARKTNENGNKVGVVIVAYNSSLATRITLSSVFKAKNTTPFELIVVDNASETDESKKIRLAVKYHASSGKLPWRYIKNSKNLGFAGGNNLGIKEFLTDESITHICLLNSDVIVPDYWLDLLVNKNCDVVTPLTNKADSAQKIPIDFQVNLQECFDMNNEILLDKELTKVNSFAQDWFYAWQGNLIQIDDATTFFCALFSREVLQSTGLLDTNFFPGGYEDNDYCERVRKDGRTICHARDAFIYHFGSSSFQLISREYFSDAKQKNQAYLEQKHSLILDKQYSYPILSFSEDLKFIANKDNWKSLQYRYVQNHINAITDLIEHVTNENARLRILVETIPQILPKDIQRSLDQCEALTDSLDLWKNKSKSLFESIINYSFSEIKIDDTLRFLDKYAAKVNELAEINILTSQWIESLADKRKEVSNVKGIFRLVGKSIKFISQLNGVIIFGGYPYPEFESDGFYQRIKQVDEIFSDRQRIYVNVYDKPGRTSWYDKPAKNILAIRIDGNWKRAVLSYLFMILCALKYRCIYFHSILSIDRFKFMLNLPGVLKILDIHGVVPEEFNYYNDFVSEEYHNQIERYAIEKANYIIVVTEKMRQHLIWKYHGKVFGKCILLPIMRDINWKISRKTFVNEKPIVVYAGGLHKWQQVPKMINVMQQTKDQFEFRFFCPNPYEFQKILPPDLKSSNSLTYGSKTSDEILDVYKESHFGFILREQSIVNSVACPTKLIEYTAMGVVPIVDYQEIGDFKSLGMQSITFEDFINGCIPNYETQVQMMKNNRKVYQTLFAIHEAGKRDLIECISLRKPAAECDLSDIDPAIKSCDILVQVGNFLSGGLENTVLGINETLILNGYKVGLLVLGESGQAVERARNLGIKVYQIKFEQSTYRNLIMTLSPKLILAHYSIEGAEICHNLGILYLQVIHNIYMWFDKEQLKDFQDTIPYTTMYIAVSEIVKSYSMERLGIPKSKCLVIPNGVDVKRIKSINLNTQRNILRKKYGFSSNDFVFLSVAAITHQKNTMGLIKSFHLALPNCPQAKLALLGPVYEKNILDEVKFYIRKNQLGNSIYYLGEAEEVFKFYSMADAFIHTSFFEGGPLVLLEALVANLPIISTEVGFACHFKTIEGIDIITPPEDIFNYQGAIWQLDSNRKFEQVIAKSIQLTYNNPVRPSLSENTIKLMDNRVVYMNYFRLIRDLISTGDINRDQNLSLWSENIKY
ncbi:MAG: glycosyltransferase [Candidatus Helarchaeota archaeon]